MSLLWSVTDNQQLLNQQRPSPRCNQLVFPQQCSYQKSSIEGISLFISLSGKRIQASMTVEAATVLPLILFFFLNLMSAVEMIRLHGNLQLALREAGNQLSVYSCAYENEEEKTIQGIVFSYFYIRNQIIDYLGQQYLEESPLVYGADGLNFLESDVVMKGDYLDITLTYQVAPEFQIPGIRSFRMVNRYYGHGWTGYEIPGTSDGQSGEKIVYVTDQGKVYHLTRECSHLSLSVQEIRLPQAYLAVNERGEKYMPCERCKWQGSYATVYLTREGNRYHNTIGCAGLKRTIYSIPLSKAEKYRPCRRCG